MLEDFFKLINPGEVELNFRLDLYSKLEEYLKTPKNESILKCADLIKFSEATLMFAKSPAAKQELDGLIVLQIFNKHLTESMQDHLVESLKLELLF
jgi:hypothetical protein